MRTCLSKVPSFLLLALSGLCLCGVACDPAMDFDDIMHPLDFSIRAVLPAEVSSMELCISSSVNDSTVCMTNERRQYSQYQYNSGSILYAIYWDSLNVSSERVEFVVDISFFCNDKKIPLPSYTIETSASEQISYEFTPFDERTFWCHDCNMEILTFLTPEDTSCGKFANYSVLKLSPKK